MLFKDRNGIIFDKHRHTTCLVKIDEKSIPSPAFISSLYMDDYVVKVKLVGLEEEYTIFRFLYQIALLGSENR